MCTARGELVMFGPNFSHFSASFAQPTFAEMPRSQSRKPFARKCAINATPRVAVVCNDLSSRAFVSESFSSSTLPLWAFEFCRDVKGDPRRCRSEKALGCIESMSRIIRLQGFRQLE